MPFYNLFYFLNIKKHVLILSVFASFITALFISSAALAQNATFKIDTRAEDKQIVLTVQNLPAAYKNVTVTRNVGGFNPAKCTDKSLAPGSEAGGFLLDPGVQYCDTNVTPETTYNYHAIAIHPPDPDLTLDVSQPYKVSGNSNTSGYKPLFGTYDLDQFINALINWVAFRVGPILVGIMIIYAGFEYIASKGDEAKTKLAKSRIYGSIIGFILLMLIGTIMRGFFL